MQEGDAIKAAAISIQAGLPTLLWGEPGTGKTAFISSLCESLQWRLVTMIASLHEPSDFIGLPYFEGGQTKFAPPSVLCSLLDDKGGAVLFFDEINTAPPAVQAALMRLVLEKRVGELKLPDSVRIVAAANPVHSNSSTWDLLVPLCNRFVHINWQGLPPEKWLDSVLKDEFNIKLPLLPEDWQKWRPYTVTVVIEFLRRNPSLIQLSPPRSSLDVAYPTRRSWHMFAIPAFTAWKSCMEKENTENEDVLYLLISGCIGEKVASEFLNFMRNLDIPPLEDVLQFRFDFVNLRRDVCSVLFSTLLVYVRDNPNMFATIVEVFAKAAREGKLDVAYPFFEQLVLFFKQYYIKTGLKLEYNPTSIEPYVSVSRKLKELL